MLDSSCELSYFILMMIKRIRMSFNTILFSALTFTTLWVDSADDKLMAFILNFPGKQDLTFHANCLHWRQFA